MEKGCGLYNKRNYIVTMRRFLSDAAPEKVGKNIAFHMKTAAEFDLSAAVFVISVRLLL